MRIYWLILDSVAWNALSWSEQGLYLAIRRKLNGSNNGNIEASLGSLKHAGMKSSATLAKGLRSLITAGFIAKTRQGGVAYGQKICSLYRFTDERVFDFPKQGIKAMRETNEWKAFTTAASVKSALQTAHQASKRPTGARSSGLQKANGARSKNEQVGALLDSKSEVDESTVVQKLKQAKEVEYCPEPA